MERWTIATSSKICFKWTFSNRISLQLLFRVFLRLGWLLFVPQTVWTRVEGVPAEKQAASSRVQTWLWSSLVHGRSFSSLSTLFCILLNTCILWLAVLRQEAALTSSRDHFGSPKRRGHKLGCAQLIEEEEETDVTTKKWCSLHDAGCRKPNFGCQKAPHLTPLRYALQFSPVSALTSSPRTHFVTSLLLKITPLYS